MNKFHEAGSSLLELMAVILILAIATVITMPMMQEQIAIREIETIARRFIAHAHFARQQALLTGKSVTIAPLGESRWSEGWVVGDADVVSPESRKTRKLWMMQGKVYPVFFKGESRHFSDPHSGKVGILFNAAGAAKTAHGGFVANRLIMGHQRRLNQERHLILGSGGRWRICDPSKDARRCH